MKRLFLAVSLFALLMMVGAVAAQNTASGKLVIVRYQVGSGADDVNQDGEGLEADLQTVWFGAGESADDSYLALRFTDVSIPSGAQIIAAHVDVYANDDIWAGLAMSLDVEAADNSAAFSLEDLPAAREITGQTVHHVSDQPWFMDTWYALDNIAPAVQAVIDRPGWAANNSLSVILHGELYTFARKFVAAYESNPHHAAQLIVIYRAP